MSGGGLRRGLRDVPRTVWLLAAGQFFNMIVAFTFVYFFVYLTDERGLSVAQAGVISGIGGAGTVAGNFTGGWFGDRYGHRRVLLVGSLISGVGVLALPALSVPPLYVVPVVSQYAAGCVRAANAALVATVVPEGARRQAFAVMRFAANAGFTVGPPLGALLIAQAGYGTLFVVDGVGTLIFAAYAARVLPARGAARAAAPTEAPDAPGVLACLRQRPTVVLLLAAILVTDLVYRQQYSTLPADLDHHGLDTGVYGWLLAINGGLILLLELPVTVALRGRAPLRIIGGGVLLVGAGYAVLAAGTGVGTAVAMMLLLTAGEVLYKTPATAYVADHAPAHAQGRFQSLYSGVSVSGVVLSAPLGGALYTVAPGALWPVCAGLAGLAGVLLLVAGRAGRPGVSRTEEVRSVRETGTRTG
ncbi:multidrug transporter [Streptomyces alboflavus]|uniref:Multidrug transporter n=1 Tax=Streptomyces alboflavus TaxID=67267 RepID=A0A1Z1W8D1_9ACTN|nr:MFS transporter [Streptomyces alboflavus]ARX82656.1 multidrug transporter [Streptomyces alboflavus]